MLATIKEEYTESVLDIGSGEGWLLAELGPLKRRIGLDTDPEIVKRACDRYPECEYLHLDGSVLPFRDGEFDVAVLSDVIEHVGDENKQNVVDEALRVVRPGGRLVVTVPHQGIWSWLDPLDFKRRYPWAYRLFKRLTKRRPMTSEKIGHQHVTKSEIAELIAGKAAMEAVEYSGWLAPAGDFPLAVAHLLGHFGLLPDRVVEMLGRWQTFEASVPAPSLAAGHLRLVARRL